mgnify:CR=1 FL=1
MQLDVKLQARNQLYTIGVAVALLMGVEFVLNAAAVNFVALSRFPMYYGASQDPSILIDGHVATVRRSIEKLIARGRETRAKHLVGGPQ